MIFEEGEKMDCVVKTMAGFEDILVDELQELGIQDIHKTTRAVSFKATLGDLYTVNYWSRYALRVLVSFHSYKAFDDKRLYSKAKQFEWDKIIDLNQTFAINSAVNSEHHTHSHFASLRVKDAIADYFNEKYDQRPSVDLDHPDVRIHLHIDNQFVTLAIDSSGDSLHKRGYRTGNFEAPLNEVLAAGMVKLSGWDQQAPFRDPMCGSGTLGIEAAMLAQNIAPQIKRRSFGFMKWPGFNQELFDKVKNKFAPKVMTAQIVCSDQDPVALRIAQAHINNLGLSDSITVKQENFLQSPPSTQGGVMVINPPYGVRLAHDDVAQFYSEMGTHIKHHLPGWKVWIFTANTQALKRFGLRPSKKLRLFNGALECAFYQYEIFEGKRKEYKAKLGE